MFCRARRSAVGWSLHMNAVISSFERFSGVRPKVYLVSSLNGGVSFSAALKSSWYNSMYPAYFPPTVNAYMDSCFLQTRSR